MTDRELLERAAKAMGDPVDGWTADADFVKVAILQSGARWQPLLKNRLTDCMGDALRLAVKLGLSIRCNKAGGTIIGYWRSSQLGEPHRNDPDAATRRAIVRAAAAIGEQAPKEQP